MPLLCKFNSSSSSSSSSCKLFFSANYFMRSANYANCFANSKRLYSTEQSSESTESTENAEPVTKERVYFTEQKEIDGFKVFDPYMKKKRHTIDRSKKMNAYVPMKKDARARYNRMPTDQDWTNIWPTQSMFKQAVIPFPVRQGFVKTKVENEGIPPAKYANTELLKIPNFLHLTPPHIHKYCNAIKKFCTPWPEGLDKKSDLLNKFPLEITTSNYIYDGPSVRDERARTVTLEINIDTLRLDKRAKDKFIRLAQHRYNPKNNVLTITTDRCPYRKQNEDYALYLLTTLYFESQKVQSWEKEMTEEDMKEYDWSKSKSRENITSIVERIKSAVGFDLGRTSQGKRVEKPALSR